MYSRNVRRDSFSHGDLIEKGINLSCRNPRRKRMGRKT